MALRPWSVYPFGYHEAWRAPHWLAHYAHGGWAGIAKGLAALAKHTGIPVTLLAAALLVVSWRLARQTSRLAVEFALALAIVATATKMGWIVW